MSYNLAGYLGMFIFPNDPTVIKIWSPKSASTGRTYLTSESVYVKPPPPFIYTL